jgi:DNA replication and repair protein RecF
MSLARLRADAVRCLSGVDIELDAKRNYLYGPNGAGKTSLLEAVSLLGRGRSFRTRQTARVVQRGAAELSVFGELAGSHGPRKLGVRFGAGSLECQVDGESGVGLAELARALPVHVIDPRLHQLIEAGPSERRRFVDSGVFHVEPAFLDAWRSYRRVLAQRNAALKLGSSGPPLDVWTEPLLVAASAVHAARAAYLDGLSDVVQALGSRLLDSEIHLEYRSGWRADQTLEDALTASEARDLQSGFTQVGPHRADLKIGFESGEVRDTASRGQQKLVAAALVLGQVHELAKRQGGAGIVLVDDPAAELDRNSLQRLLGEIDRVDGQLLLTGLSESVLVPEPGAKVFHVEQGRVRPVV